MPNIPDYHPDKPFDGLGFIGWCRVIFKSRAATVKQCDTVTRSLFEHLQEATDRAYMAETRLAKMSAHVVQCHEAMTEAYNLMHGRMAEGHCEKLAAAIEAGKQPL